jgi:hypothetical protein
VLAHTVKTDDEDDYKLASAAVATADNEIVARDAKEVIVKGRHRRLGVRTSQFLNETASGEEEVRVGLGRWLYDVLLSMLWQPFGYGALCEVGLCLFRTVCFCVLASVCLCVRARCGCACVCVCAGLGGPL